MHTWPTAVSARANHRGRARTPNPSTKKSTKRNKHSLKKSWRCSENSAALNSEGTPAGGRWTGGQAVIDNNQLERLRPNWWRFEERERERNMWSDSGEHFRTECSPAHRGNFCFLWGHQKKNHFQNFSFFFFFQSVSIKKMSQIYSHNSFQMKSQGPEMPPDVYTFGSCRKELSVGFFLEFYFGGGFCASPVSRLALMWRTGSVGI